MRLTVRLSVSRARACRIPARGRPGSLNRDRGRGKAKPPERLAEAGIASRSAASAIAVAETVNGLFKAEIIHRRGQWCSFEAVEYAALERVERFNDRPLSEPIGSTPPA